ncbi:sigma-70 family RNA polymerase sigma factor [Pontibacillus yanchengensis]|uniref:Sigma-70 family RNA polymerase sigma factor n=2 Tax=Pontibacillus yanchengensis TaxID=462910 RepID=A0ACC7VMK7_9BACI|nr:sigma-70 family RNA polymerase sigma factor [Pontibacillus yanchengensis]MYL36136.1 sigma-70 family RNA polymerase sigma factor [Pontibacillus yanchengensis]MYL55876.1 sigma-70 family RNA polymerase sigma factor [Pontibacillus yanchengensis]
MEEFSEQELMKDPFMRRFLADEENYRLFKNYQQMPTEETAVSLNNKFQEELKKVRAISYLSKSIHYWAVDFDKKQRKYSERFTATLDQPLDNDGDYTHKDNLQSNKEISYKPATSIEDVIQNPSLMKVVSTLTLRQKNILFSLFVLGLTENEIAEKKGVSQQVISKSKQKALKKLRGELNGGNDLCRNSG